MTTVAEALKSAHEQLGDIENDVRGGMVNHHLADVIASARGKLADAAKHPDAAASREELEAKREELERAKDPFYQPHPQAPFPPVAPAHVEAAPYGDTMKT